MKKIAIGLVGGAFCLGFFAQRAEAVNPGTITITVTCRYLNITISPGTATFAGVVDPGVGTVTVGSNTITNAGNAAITLRIKGSNTTSGDWVIGSSTGTNEFVLSALFNSSAPPLGSFTITGTVGAGDCDRLQTADITSSDTSNASGRFTAVGNNQDGANIAVNNSVNIWFRFDAPNPPTMGSDTQNIVVTISAAAP